MIARPCAALLLLAACARPATTPTSTSSRPALSARDPVGAGVLAAMDPTVDPCVDFYRHACGGWLARTRPPADKPRHGRGFGELADRNSAALRRIFERAAATPAPDSPVDRKLGAFWSACMDEAAIEAAGLTPLAPMLARVAGVEDEAGLWRVLGELHSSFPVLETPLFSLAVEPDARRPDVNVLYLLQGGLGLPSRDLYTDERRVVDYRRHVERMLVLLGEPAARATTRAAAVVALETRLAALSLPLADLREADRTYHPLGTEGLQRLDPKLPWTTYFTALGHPKIGANLVVMTPGYFAEIGEVVRKTPPEILQAYLRWHILRSTAPALGRELAAAHFEFAASLSGAARMLPRWERCVQLTNVFDEVTTSSTGMMISLGDMVGQSFVREHFVGASADIVRMMTRSIEAAFAARLPALAWMDPTTRARALEKLAAVNHKIGHPERWRDHTGLQLVHDGHLTNVLAVRRFEFARNAARIGGPVDRDQWWMPPAIVNAYYEPFHNEIVLPAGILQPPHFGADFPMSMNFGGIGMVIGHELIHGFDDQGRKYDATGTLRDWWDPSAAAGFRARAQCIEDLYDGREVVPGAALDGRQMLGENIADFGGLRFAHAGYRAWLADHEDRRPIAGLGDDQLFFLNFAQIWCAHDSPESLRLRASVDQHAPSDLRVNLALQHFPAFAEAWQCAPGSPMRAPTTCEVW